MKQIKEFLRHEYRSLILLAVTLPILAMDGMIGSLVHVIGFITLALVIGHLGRKLMMPYVNLHQLVRVAGASPLGAGLVILAATYLFTQIMSVAVQLVK